MNTRDATMEAFLRDLEEYRYRNREQPATNGFDSALSSLEASQAQWMRDMQGLQPAPAQAPAQAAPAPQPVMPAQLADKEYARTTGALDASQAKWQAGMDALNPSKVSDAEAQSMYEQLAREDAEWQRQMAELYGGGQ